MENKNKLFLDIWINIFHFKELLNFLLFFYCCLELPYKMLADQIKIGKDGKICINWPNLCRSLFYLNSCALIIFNQKNFLSKWHLCMTHCPMARLPTTNDPIYFQRKKSSNSHSRSFTRMEESCFKLMLMKMFPL